MVKTFLVQSTETNRIFVVVSRCGFNTHVSVLSESRLASAGNPGAGAEISGALDGTQKTRLLPHPKRATERDRDVAIYYGDHIDFD